MEQNHTTPLLQPYCLFLCCIVPAFQYQVMEQNYTTRHLHCTTSICPCTALYLCFNQSHGTKTRHPSIAALLPVPELYCTCVSIPSNGTKPHRTSIAALLPVAVLHCTCVLIEVMEQNHTTPPSLYLNYTVPVFRSQVMEQTNIKPPLQPYCNTWACTILCCTCGSSREAQR